MNSDETCYISNYYLVLVSKDSNFSINGPYTNLNEINKKYNRMSSETNQIFGSKKNINENKKNINNHNCNKNNTNKNRKINNNINKNILFKLKDYFNKRNNINNNNCNKNNNNKNNNKEIKNKFDFKHLFELAKYHLVKRKRKNKKNNYIVLVSTKNSNISIHGPYSSFNKNCLNISEYFEELINNDIQNHSNYNYFI